MDEEISFHEFEQIIASVNGTINANSAAIHLVFFIHNVVGLKSGLYIMIRNSEHKHALMKECKASFLWESIDTKAGSLFLLQEGDFKEISKAVSCSQNIARDSSFSLGMIASFDQQINTYGTHRYKELYWECGAIGQQLYLESTSLGLSATGIGCYLDDMFHHILGIENMSFQSLYHFTVGRGLVDNRLSTLKPYTNRT
jgi:nitroreductase